MLMIVPAECDRAGVAEGAGPLGGKAGRGAPTVLGEHRRGQVEIGYGESRRLAALVEVEQDDLHRVSLFDPECGVGLTIDRTTAPEKSVVAISGGKVRPPARPHLGAADKGERLDLRPSGQYLASRRQREAGNESEECGFVMVVRHRCSPVKNT